MHCLTARKNDGKRDKNLLARYFSASELFYCLQDLEVIHPNVAKKHHADSNSLPLIGLLDTLVEAGLFGYEKGASTRALRSPRDRRHHRRAASGSPCDAGRSGASVVSGRSARASPRQH